MDHLLPATASRGERPAKLAGNGDGSVLISSQRRSRRAGNCVPRTRKLGSSITLRDWTCVVYAGLVVSFTSSALFFAILPVSAHANPTDSNGYIENWGGNIVSEFNGNVIPPAIASTQPISQLITTNLSPSSTCKLIQSAVAKLGGGATVRSCNVGPPELRGKMLSQNELGLKLVFSNLSMVVQVNGAAGDNPKFEVTTDPEVHVTILIVSCVDGAVAVTHNPSTLCNPSTPPTNTPLSGMSVRHNQFFQFPRWNSQSVGSARRT
jgi:hypothetical protein